MKFLDREDPPALYCRAGEVFIRPDRRGYWVYLWDGNEARLLETTPFESLADVIATAQAAEERREYAEAFA